MIFSGCTLIACLLFYRNRLKKPLAALDEASQRVLANDLNFSVGYASNDEIGRLCATYEKMRISLLDSNRELWRALEERKRLNASFSHDLRTPLTVLRGYADLLEKYVPQDKLQKEKLISTISLCPGRSLVWKTM